MSRIIGRPISYAQRYLLTASAVIIALGWTYGAATTDRRSVLLSWLPFSPRWVGWAIVALGILSLISAFQHRGLPQWAGWGAAMLAPGMLAAIWTATALTRTPLAETLHVLAALTAAGITGVIAIRWGRHRTWRLLLCIASGMTAAASITASGDVTQWSSWSSAVLYIGWCVMIYLGAASTEADR